MHFILHYVTVTVVVAVLKISAVMEARGSSTRLSEMV